MVAKTRFVLVILESVLSGHQHAWIRDRAAQKVERLLFDPKLRSYCLFREIKRRRGVNDLPKFFREKLGDDCIKPEAGTTPALSINPLDLK